MRSTVVFTVILVVLILAIVGGVVIYAPTPNQHGTNAEVTPTANGGKPPVNATPIQLPDNQSDEQAQKPTPIANGSNNASTFDPIPRAHQAANSQNPVSKERSWLGYVFNAKDQKPMANVSVVVNGSAVAKTREADGLFMATLPREVHEAKALLSFPGYKSIEVQLSNNKDQNLFFLVPEGSLFIEVIDNANNPVLYANISLKSNKGFWSKKSTADIRGHYFEPNPPDSPLTISAEYEGFDDAGQATKIVDPPFGEKVVLQLHRPYYTISGRVVERDTQKGVEYVNLEALDMNIIKINYATTNKDGFYEFSNVFPGSYQITAKTQDKLYLDPAQSSRAVRVIDKNASNVNFELVRGYNASGVVVDSNGNPVPDARVYLTPHPTNPQVQFMMEDQVATTDEQGRFTLYNLPPTNNKESRIAAVHSELGSGVSESFDPSADDVGPFTITLSGPSTVEGIVVDESGAAVAGAIVVVQPSDYSLLRLAGNSFQTTTGEAGEFKLTLSSALSLSDKSSLSNHQYTITAGTEPPDRDQSKVQNVQKTIELLPEHTVNVTLILPNQTGVIKGRVTNQSGAPVESTAVIARHHRYGSFDANTDANGVYEFGRSGDLLTSTQFLPEGVYDLEFVGPGNPVQRGALYQVKTGTLNADVVLTSKVWRVTGGVIDAESREPLHQFGIYIEYDPVAERALPYFKTVNLNSFDGTYEVPFFETGRYRLRFYADGYEPQAGLITVLEDSKEVQVLNAELKKTETTGSIQGIFVSASGSQLGKVEVAGIGVFPAQNNQFLIENLPPGQHDLVFYLFETASQSYIPIGVLTSVTVQAGGRTQIGPVTAANLQTRYVSE